MYIALLCIIVVYHMVMSVIDSNDTKKYFSGEKKVNKIRFLKEAVLWGWITTIIVFIFIAMSEITLHDIGFRGVSLSNTNWLNIVTFIICGMGLAILLIQTIQCLIPKNKKALREDFDKKKKSDNIYDWAIYNLVLPETKKERKWFFFLSLTAGICEEIIWRGTIIFLLSAVFPALNFMGAAIISCILFGLMHSYQGIYGIIKTGIISVLFVLLYYVTDSIIPGMLVHFLFDYSSVVLAGDENKYT